MNDNAKPSSQRERKRHAILTAAKKIFLKNGFTATSMDEIALLAEVSKATIYQHFGNKHQLFQTILIEHLHSALTGEHLLFTPDKTTAVNLTQFATAFLAYLYQPATIDLYRILISESSRLPNLLELLPADGKTPSLKALTDFLTTKQQSGELAIQDAGRAAAHFIGLLKEYHFWPMMMGLAKPQQSPQEQKRLVNEAVTLFIKAYGT